MEFLIFERAEEQDMEVKMLAPLHASRTFSFEWNWKAWLLPETALKNFPIEGDRLLSTGDPNSYGTKLLWKLSVFHPKATKQ